MTPSSRAPLSVFFHLVLDADKVCYETGPLDFDEVAERIRDGQFGDVYHVISVKFENDVVGVARDTTHDIAIELFRSSGKHPLIERSPAYTFIERELSPWHAAESIHAHRDDTKRRMGAC